MRKGIYTLMVCFIGAACAQNVPSVGTDSTLDVATWNIEWFGDAGSGPSDETTQFNNVKTVITNSEIDVWGLQEISNPTACSNLVTALPNYNGVISTWSQTQKTGLLYNKNKFTFIYQKHILALYANEYASGRLPLEVALEFKHDNRTDTLYFFVLHMKANTGSNSDKALAVTRRKLAADALKKYLDDDYKGKYFFIIGDWNDDLDKTIYNNTTSPYRQFANDTTNYFFASEILTNAGKRSTVSYSNMIDHICASKNAKMGFLSESEVDVFRLDSYITGYGNNTSDHYPVYCKFNASQWKVTTPSVDAKFVKNSPTIFWDGTQLTIPFKYYKIEYFTTAGQLVNGHNLPKNTLIVYSIYKGNTQYTGKFIIQ